MKCLAVTAGAALALCVRIAPALAIPTSPSIALTPLAPAPLGVVSATAGCAKPASVDGTPYWFMPAIAAEQGAGGIAQIEIHLSSSGKLTDRSLFASSGNPWLDAAALTSASMTRFTSEVVDCRHVGGAYLYDVEF
jgi:TonB family protein